MRRREREVRRRERRGREKRKRDEEGEGGEGDPKSAGRLQDLFIQCKSKWCHKIASLVDVFLVKNLNPQFPKVRMC